MAETELDKLIHSLIFAETLDERMEARFELRFRRAGLDVLRPIFEEFVRYIRELVTGQRAPRGDNHTPLLQFYDAFAQIQYLLWAWYDDEPIIGTLIEMLNDPNRNVRALALVSLGEGNVMWKETARVEPYLRARQDDPDPLIRAAANLAVDAMSFGRHVEAMTSPDAVMFQRLEQYAAQVMSGLVGASSHL